MKKFLLSAAVACTCIMCKKAEGTSQWENTAATADSTVSDISHTIQNIHDEDRTVADSAGIRIKELDDTGHEIRKKIETQSKSIDSLTESIASVKLESAPGKKDSAENNKEEKIVVNVQAPKVIRETKVIYKNQPKKQPIEKAAVADRLVKTGTLELTVSDPESAKETVIQQVEKYDGFLKSENISLNNNEKKIAYLRIKIPIQKFDYLMDDLSYNIGKVETQSIEVSGKDFIRNTLCEVDITLYGSENPGESTHPETLGGRSLAAISSGWEAVASVFLFILPLWPLFLIAGAGYYFYKKKRRTESGKDSEV
ncbi:MULTISPECIES: DUF4349 domain-containing protein [Chryseobacterium]|nr:MULTISPECIES: DUF4349 domain-containing protein [Chryseobacterium]